MMRFRISEPWALGDVICPAHTVIDASANDYWSQRVKGKVIPFNAVPLDAQAYEEQVKAYPEAKHLLGGAWEDK